jgi:hypothetical protein
MTMNNKFFQRLEEINTVRWKMNEMANACKTLGLKDFSADLTALSNDLDDIVDKLTEDREAETPRRGYDILSDVLSQSIEDDEAGART